MVSSPPPGPFNIQKVAIIGAGPTGLAAAKYLLAEKCFPQIDIFEQQAEVGGVWNYTSIPSEKVSVPSNNPHVPPDPPIWPDDGKEGAPLFSNPMYEKLNTNIPKSIMRFSDLAFEEGSLLFPTRQDVQRYLVGYAEGVRGLIEFSTRVEGVRLVDRGRERWEVRTRGVGSGEVKVRVRVYDAVVCANGHYSIPYIPDVPGIEAFNKKYPDVITHSKIYRKPEGFKGKKVIVCGSGPSGQDIGTQIATVCRQPLLNSVTTPQSDGKKGKEEVPHIAEYLTDERAVRFTNGRVEKNIDAVVYCTGYLYGYHFLESLSPPLVTTGRRVLGAYKHLFDIYHPTLAFTALMYKVIPFPVSEAQGAVVAKVWANRLALPGVEEMERWEEERVKEVGEGRPFHVMGYPADVEYLNGLCEWVRSAGGNEGKEPPFWGDREVFIRKVYVKMKERFEEAGGTARTMEELGYVFEPEES
ncbi:hypothetical protein HYFRA_00013340 [Hymenoscyphus fraxineus]|uniref:Thiol-specific monooxygenase n=1 Tax=Hymenoscyphus fraxineus TaxID=746836 RepID=A0A9N9LDB5_9HELO|nr:hypothetical protein HYFRA_00013340 [Hymenoscyphus fraxineus]